LYFFFFPPPSSLSSTLLNSAPIRVVLYSPSTVVVESDTVPIRGSWSPSRASIDAKQILASILPTLALLVVLDPLARRFPGGYRTIDSSDNVRIKRSSHRT
jgi:hypothetical protein